MGEVIKVNIEGSEKNVSVKQISDCGWSYTFADKTEKGEKVVVHMTECTCDPKDKKTIPYQWKQHGYTKELLQNFLSIQTYVTKGSDCHGLYNPQRLREGGINFEWLLKTTAENRIKLLTEVGRLAFESENYKKFEGKVVNLTITGTMSGEAVFLKDRGEQIEYQWINVSAADECMVYPMETYTEPERCYKKLIDSIHYGPEMTADEIFDTREAAIEYDMLIFERYEKLQKKKA